jgi:RNA polymerase sigma-70 factor (ECF subfamily)
MPHRDSKQTADLDALVVSARTDREAFGRLYEAYYERILRYCLRRLYRQSVAEDVCGEVFLYVARKMRSFRGTTEQDFRRWLYRIATTEVNAYLRRTKRRQELWDKALQNDRLSPSNAVTNDNAYEGLDWPVVYQAISQLSTKQQTVITLRLFDDMPYKEIADVLNVRPGTARVTYNRAIKRLRSLLSVNSHKTDKRTAPSV